ncbi:hypothetical protein FA95DRAFT_1563141 [Auriscalpium vulgare]|uniref:Uncharacterized protein n=1 Tax=Auriscalpium vulgare TaxID=40419 RepID=A0ACB8RJ28_9AGAM|nr:hypothetical protein FA95DRAFT_1563141 [Auriscalpium vulgare]
MSSSAPLVIPIPPNIGEIATPMVLGICFNFCLYGVLAAQVYSYQYNFPKDKWIFKVLVYGVFLIETSQTAMSGADIVYWFASGFGNLARLRDTYLSPFDTPFMGSFVAFIVQLFYSYRIWVLNKKLLWLSGLIALVSLTQVIGGTVAGVQGHRIRFSQAKQPVAAAYTWFIGDAVADMLVAVTMVWLLTKSQNDQHHYSSRVLAKVMRLCVETNVASATVALVSLILYAGYRDKTYFLAVSVLLGKIYSNTLLVSLNSRAVLRDAAATGTRVFVHSESAVHHSQSTSGVSNRAVVLPYDSASVEMGTPYKGHQFSPGIELGALGTSRDIEKGTLDRDVVAFQNPTSALGSY